MRAEINNPPNTEQPSNYFQDIEQACFSPSNMVPGVGPSADPGMYPTEISLLKMMHAYLFTLFAYTVLQARMFSYPDAHRYRVGPNYFQLPPNRPINPVYSPYVRDGPGTMNGNYGGDPDYVFSELHPVKVSKRVALPTHEAYAGHVTAFATSMTDDDFKQARQLWKIICHEKNGKEQFLHNILPTLADIPDKLKAEVLGKWKNSECRVRGLADRVNTNANLVRLFWAC